MATRNVFFYEVRPTRIVDAEWRLNVPGLMAALSALSVEDRIRIADGGTGDSYEFVQVIEDGLQPAIAYVRCREHGLPMLAREATLEPLQIAADRQLAELTHAVFFNHHVVGAEYNHYGPRITSLGTYLADKVPQCLPSNQRVRIASLVNSEVIALLGSAKSVMYLELMMAPQLFDAVQAGRHLRAPDALREMSAGYGAQRVGLKMRNRRGLDKNEVLGLVNWAVEEGSGLLSSAITQVELENGTHQTINLLKSRIGAESEMELMGPKARSIAHHSARTEIVATFGALENQIRAAASIWSMGPDEHDT